MADEAGLALVIDPAKALRELKRFESGIDSAANSVTGFARRVKSDFEIIGNAAEAIMPLRRTSSGRLGVEATGGPGGAMTLPTPVFNVTDATTGKTTVEATDVKYDGQRLLVGMVLKDRRNNGPMARAARK